MAGNANSGRRKGEPPAKAQAVKDRLWKALKKEYGEDFEPIVKMAEIGMDDNNDVETRLRAWKEISPYLYPKLKQVEISGNEDQPLRTKVVMEIVDPTAESV